MSKEKINKKGLLFVFIVVIGLLCYAYMYDMLSIVAMSIVGGIILSFFIVLYIIKLGFYVFDRFVNEW